MAHYIWPPQWVGPLPEWVIEPGFPVRREDLADVVADVELSVGIRIRAFRDGLLAFDLGSWGDPVKTSDASRDNFEAVAEYQVRCARLMNAHLACLHTTTQGSLKPTVLAPNRVISVRWVDGRFEAGGGEGIMSLALWKARTEVSDWNDWRLLSRSGPPITTEAIEKSFELLRDLLDQPDQAVVLLRAELLFRSAAAYSDHDPSNALVHAWTATEGLLGDLLAGYLDGRQDMNYKRKAFLKGSSVQARVTAELLSIAGHLPLPLYNAIVQALSRRNGWLHAQKPITAADAESAIQAAQDLFEIVEGVRLQMPLGRQLHSLG